MSFRAAVAEIPRERSTESSDASRGLRVDLQDFARTSFSPPPSGICLGSTTPNEGHQVSSYSSQIRAPNQGFGDGFVAAQRPTIQARVVGGSLASPDARFSPEQDDSL